MDLRDRVLYLTWNEGCSKPNNESEMEDWIEKYY